MISLHQNRPKVPKVGVFPDFPEFPGIQVKKRLLRNLAGRRTRFKAVFTRDSTADPLRHPLGTQVLTFGGGWVTWQTLWVGGAFEGCLKGGGQLKGRLSGRFSRHGSGHLCGVLSGRLGGGHLSGLLWNPMQG